MTHYIKNGALFTVTSDDALDIHNSLPIGTYTVKMNPMSGEYYLEIIDNFEIPQKIYGTTTDYSDRILNTFQKRDSATGVLLSGEQGSGKTLLAKLLSVKARELGMPTIVINNPWYGEVFNVFMQSIDQPSVVIFDEFEKVYDSAEQEKLLTLLDGVYPSRKLFVLTTNDNFRVNSRMRNRPGRIFYSLKYTGLDVSFITEYCQDRLNDKSHIEDICKISMAFSEFNFDILQALVEDMNRYDESPQEVMTMLNARPEEGGNSLYDYELSVKGKTTVSDSWRGNPLGSSVAVAYDHEDDYDVFEFSFADLRKIDVETGKFLFEDEEGNVLSMVKQAVTSFNWGAVL